jgi:hypothetical protein
VALSSPDDQNARMTSDDVGHRCADGAFEWTAGKDGDRLLVIRHFAPDVISHWYSPGGINEPILLYRGRFTAQADEIAPERACDGDIRLSWLPTPGIEVRGEYHPGPGHLEAFLDSGADTRIWHPRLQVHIPPAGQVPPAPVQEAPPWSRERATAYLGPAEVYPPEIGDGTVLTRVTGLLPNGWDGYGSRVADPADPRRTWFGRATVHGGGWVLDTDALEPGGELLGALRRRGGYGVTHAVSLSRADESPFTAEDSTTALQAVRSALSLVLGRRTDVVLPVGWKDGQPVWVRWTAGQVDTFREPGSWLDASIAAAQVSEVVGRFLDCWPDPLRQATLRYATSYYVQALALGAELGTAAAVSGLLLLGSSWLVEDRHLHSRTAWEKRMEAESQIRALLEFPECRVSTAVPVAFDYLAAVARQLDATKKPDEVCRDGLGCVIKMRNDVMHPTRTKRTKWSGYQWSEAHSLAVHFLELALLAYVGYRGKYHPRISANRWLGYAEDVPWTGCLKASRGVAANPVLASPCIVDRIDPGHNLGGGPSVPGLRQGPAPAPRDGTGRPWGHAPGRRPGGPSLGQVRRKNRRRHRKTVTK